MLEEELFALGTLPEVGFSSDTEIVLSQEDEEEDTIF